MTQPIRAHPSIRMTAAALAAFLWATALAGEFPPARVETFTLATEAPNNRALEFALRLPVGFTPERAAHARILVTFGGRNWAARRTLSTYAFDAFADQYNIILLAPGFQDDDYWEPEAWSGEALKAALKRVREQYALPDKPIFLYGYSAGGQCANLFYAWKPERVAGWGAHACGVWFKPAAGRGEAADEVPATPAAHGRVPAPALVTCGVEDEPRYTLSRHFVYAYREAGGEAVWRDYPGGHELIPDPVALAAAFFASLLEKPDGPPEFVGDDDTGQFVSVREARAVERIPPELRSAFRTEAVAQAWQRPATGE